LNTVRSTTTRTLDEGCHLNLRWTLDNAWQRLRDGHPFDFIKHVGAIVLEDVRFAVARLFRSAGV